MATYCTTIENDILRDCTNLATKGTEQKVLLIPVSLLPSSGITLDGTYPNALITAISLSSSSGRLIEGYMKKDWMGWNNTYTNPDDGSPGFIHTLEGIRILDPSVEMSDEINKLAHGEPVFAIMEAHWKGTSSADAFRFFGFKFGLQIPDGGIVDNSKENDGAPVITLQTPSGFKEPYRPHVFLDTDYSTTQTAVWTNKLV